MSAGRAWSQPGTDQEGWVGWAPSRCAGCFASVVPLVPQLTGEGTEAQRGIGWAFTKIPARAEAFLCLALATLGHSDGWV